MDLRKTAKFWVVELSLPRLRLAGLRGVEVPLRRHSYVILTDLGTELEARLGAHSRSTSTFFESETKATRTGSVYVSERGVPMFCRGYERQVGIRECFRVAMADLRSSGDWAPSQEAKAPWLQALRPLKRIADAALTACHDSPREDDDEDFSLAFAFCYEAAGDIMQVTEHCDKSLIVVSPVAEVPGLEVYDIAAKRWICVEPYARAGRDLVLFGGTALEDATGIPACRHRVRRRSHRRRHSFILELKYARYYRHLRHFGD